MKNRNQKIGIFIVGLAMSIGLIYFIVTTSEEKKELTQESAMLEEELAKRDSSYNQAVDLLFGIEAEVERIKNRENIISDRTMNEHDEYSQAQIIEDMQSIDSLIISANSRISNLVQQLEKADIDLNSFKRRVAQLDKELKDRSQSIALLKEDLKTKDIQIAGLENNVESLEKENEQQLLTISDQMDELLQHDLDMHKAYIAIGSKDELEKQNLITREGGFLGLGKTTELADDATVENFTEVDVRLTDMLLLDASKIDLVTEHPTDSYRLLYEGDQISHIEITNPDKFWKLSNYLVITVKS